MERVLVATKVLGLNLTGPAGVKGSFWTPTCKPGGWSYHHQNYRDNQGVISKHALGFHLYDIIGEKQKVRDKSEDMSWLEGERLYFMQWCKYSLGFSVAQLVKNLPVMQENPVQFLGQKDTLEKG